MNYIKKFNEELLPSTYRNAASKLKGYRTSQALAKSDKLKDYADEKDFGLYNMHFCTTTSIITTSTFTEPRLIGIYYGGLPNTNSSDAVYAEWTGQNNANTMDSENLAEGLVKRWIDGSDELSINFEFGMRPTQEAITKSKNHSWLIDHFKGGRYLSHVPVFTIQLLLSDWNEGLEEYDSEAKWEAERHDDDFIPTPIGDFFEWTQDSTWLIYKPMCSHYAGLFSDRKSAQKFLSFFQQTMQSDKVRESIINILRIIGANSKSLEYSLNAYKEVRIHGLYDENPISPKSGSTYQSTWFNKRID